MFVIARALVQRSEGGVCSRELVEQVADELGRELVDAYAAVGFHPMLQLERSHEVALAACTGICGQKGGLALLEHLLQRREEREAAGEPLFDVVPMGCVNLCDYPPAALAASPDGVAGLPNATRAQLDEAIELMCPVTEPSE